MLEHLQRDCPEFKKMRSKNMEIFWSEDGSYVTKVEFCCSEMAEEILEYHNISFHFYGAGFCLEVIQGDVEYKYCPFCGAEIIGIKEG